MLIEPPNTARSGLTPEGSALTFLLNPQFRVRLALNWTERNVSANGCGGVGRAAAGGSRTAFEANIVDSKDIMDVVAVVGRRGHRGLSESCHGSAHPKTAPEERRTLPNDWPGRRGMARMSRMSRMSRPRLSRNEGGRTRAAHVSLLRLCSCVL